MTEEPKIPLTDNLFLAHGAEIDRVVRRAVRNAVLEHKRAGRSIAVWRDGKVVIVPPEEIEVEDEPNT